MGQKLGAVIVSPRVLAMIARLTTLAVPGVARMSSLGVERWIRTADTEGVRVQVIDESVMLDVYVVARPDVSMLKLSRDIQSRVTRAILEIVGMAVREVNVHILDVADEPPALN
jgi:uncharacterized alkaline shock family protein YloU